MVAKKVETAVGEELPVDREEYFKGVRRLVVKLGTRVVTVGDNRMNSAVIDRLAGEVAELRQRGLLVAVVSSGAVGAGMGRLGLRLRPRRIPELQATAAVGQGLLMNAYKLAFRKYGIIVGQVLLTAEDLDDRWRYVNARNTLESLFRFGAVPIINENDSVAVEENKVGDNDRLSAQIAHLIDADLVVLFTDVDGLYSSDPSGGGEPELISHVRGVTPELISGCGDAGSPVSLGGMQTKLQAAESVTSGGRMMVIANGHTTGILEVVDGGGVGTLFFADPCRLTGRKLWIANSRSKGAVTVDEGAVRAVRDRGKSLLPSGVVAVKGSFASGELIGVEDSAGREIARGLVRYPADQVRRILGHKTAEAAEILQVDSPQEVIHRDDMVVIVDRKAEPPRESRGLAALASPRS